MPTYNRPRARKKDRWGWEGAAQGAVGGLSSGVSIGSLGGPKGAVVGGAIGAGLGLVTGGLWDTDPTPIDRRAYDEAADLYAKQLRSGTRMASDELSAQTGAALAGRGVNNSAMAAGIVSANRGRMRRMAEQQIAKYRGDLNMAIADAENQAQQTHDAVISQEWSDLAGQIADDAEIAFGNLKKARKTTVTDQEYADRREFELANVEQGGFPKEGYTKAITSAAASVTQAHPSLTLGEEEAEAQGDSSLSMGDKERDEWWKPDTPRWGERETSGTPPLQSTERPKPTTQHRAAPRVTSAHPRVTATESVVPPEEMDVLRTLFPDLDDILSDPDDDPLNIGDSTQGVPTSAPPKIRLVPFNPNTGKQESGVPDVPDVDRSNPFRPPLEELTPDIQSGVEGPVLTLPERTEGAETEAAPQQRQYPLRSQWISDRKMEGLKGYMAFVFTDEGGYNSSDPSYQGITQVMYDAFPHKPADAPEDVKGLAGRDGIINGFYKWYIDTQTFIPESMTKTEGLEYIYNDLAIHAGGSRAREVYRNALVKLGNVLIPSSTELMNAFQQAKLDHYQRQGANANAFQARARNVYQRAIVMR